MGKNKMGRPSWFKLFLHHKSLIDAVPDEVAGRALKAALRLPGSCAPAED